MPFVMAHFPSGSSTKNFVHYQQMLKKDQFKMFDYGEKKNMKIYGQKTAPHYDLSKITFPVHLYVGKYDRLADQEDAKRLFNELTNSVGKVLIILCRQQNSITLVTLLLFGENLLNIWKML